MFLVIFLFFIMSRSLKKGPFFSYSLYKRINKFRSIGSRVLFNITYTVFVFL